MKKLVNMFDRFKWLRIVVGLFLLTLLPVSKELFFVGLLTINSLIIVMKIKKNRILMLEKSRIFKKFSPILEKIEKANKEGYNYNPLNFTKIYSNLLTSTNLYIMKTNEKKLNQEVDFFNEIYKEGY